VILSHPLPTTIARKIAIVDARQIALNTLIPVEIEAREEYSDSISRVLDGHAVQYRHICREVGGFHGPLKSMGDICDTRFVDAVPLPSFNDRNLTVNFTSFHSQLGNDDINQE
jgi:hypothetical protein